MQLYGRKGNDVTPEVVVLVPHVGGGTSGGREKRTSSPEGVALLGLIRGQVEDPCRLLHGWHLEF